MIRRCTGVRCALPAFTLFLSLLVTSNLYGQGCILARSSSVTGGPQTEGGYLSPGEFNFTIGLRHQYSFRHFVGDVEQKYRIQQGTQVENKINLLNFNLDYQLTPRFSVQVDAPLLLASRRSNNSPYTTTAQGIGDTIVSAQGWVWNPTENTKGNVAFSLGAMFPSGNDHVMNRVDKFDGKGPVDTLVDYSIQPGSGGYGIVLGWQSFKNFGTSAQAYFNGSYIATPQNTNGIVRSTTAKPLLQQVSISDQYLLEGGVAVPIRSLRGFTVTAGPRWEGVPARDLFGASDGFRRPGYAVSLEGGFQYVHRRQLFTATVGKAIHRDRTVSYPDSVYGAHGDAAFADYIWLASYSVRFGGRQHSMESHHSDSKTHQAPPSNAAAAHGAV
jgi:hypothetical protein